MESHVQELIRTYATEEMTEISSRKRTKVSNASTVIKDFTNPAVHELIGSKKVNIKLALVLVACASIFRRRVFISYFTAEKFRSQDGLEILSHAIKYSYTMNKIKNPEKKRWLRRYKTKASTLRKNLREIERMNFEIFSHESVKAEILATSAVSNMRGSIRRSIHDEI